jgi:hypothetical protein
MLSRDYLYTTSLGLAQIPPPRQIEIARKYRYGCERLGAMRTFRVPVAIDVFSRSQLLFEEQQVMIEEHYVTADSPLKDLIAALQPVQDPQWRSYTRVRKVQDLGRLLSSKYLSSRQKCLLRRVLVADKVRRKALREEKAKKKKPQRKAKGLSSKRLLRRF